jgi:hypothetical protein
MANKDVRKAQESLNRILEDLRGVCEIRIKGWKLELPERETSGLIPDEKRKVQREQETYTNARLGIQVFRDTLAEIKRRQKIIHQCQEVIRNLEEKLPHYEEQARIAVNEFEQAHYRIAEIMGHRKVANRCRRREKGNETMAKKTTKKTETPKKTETQEVESIEDLLTRLEQSDDAAEKRNIRAKLRRQGHYGGLQKGTDKATPKKTSKKKTSKKTPKKKTSKKTSKKTAKKKTSKKTAKK